MATFNSFEEIIAWQKARFFCSEVNKIIQQSPLSTDYKLKDQINASSGSIMDNIAEGFGRGGNKEFIQFLEISHASACESQSQLYRIVDRNYITAERFRGLYDIVEEIKKMTISLIKYLSESSISGPKYKWRGKKKPARKNQNSNNNSESKTQN